MNILELRAAKTRLESDLAEILNAKLHAFQNEGITVTNLGIRMERVKRIGEHEQAAVIGVSIECQL